MPPVLQTNFDKAFITAVQVLKDQWPQHKKFRHVKELFDQLGIHYKSWSGIRNGLRNVPADKVIEVRHILVQDYNVSPLFLKTNEGNIFSRKATWLKGEKVLSKDQLITTLKAQIKSRDKEILLLRQQIKRAKTRAITTKKATKSQQ